MFLSNVLAKSGAEFIDKVGTISIYTSFREWLKSTKDFGRGLVCVREKGFIIQPLNWKVDFFKLESRKVDFFLYK